MQSRIVPSVPAAGPPKKWFDMSSSVCRDPGPAAVGSVHTSRPETYVESERCPPHKRIEPRFLPGLWRAIARRISNLDDIHSFGLQPCRSNLHILYGPAAPQVTSVTPVFNKGFKRPPPLCVIRFLGCLRPAKAIASILLSS